jgi:hypothetical protein
VIAKQLFVVSLATAGVSLCRPLFALGQQDVDTRSTLRANRIVTAVQVDDRMDEPFFVFVVWNSGYITNPLAAHRFPDPSVLSQPLNSGLVVKVVHRFVN